MLGERPPEAVGRGQAMKDPKHAELAHKDYCIAQRKKNELLEQLDREKDLDEQYKILGEIEKLERRINTYARLIVIYVFGDEI